MTAAGATTRETARELAPVAVLVALPGTVTALAMLVSGALPVAAGVVSVLLNAGGAVAVSIALGRGLRRRVGQVRNRRRQGRVGGGWTVFRRSVAPLVEDLDYAREAMAANQARADAVTTILDAIPDPLLWIDGQANIAVANTAANTLLGGAQPLAGRGLSTVLRHPKLLAAVSDARTGGSHHAVEIKLPVAAVERSLEAIVAPLPPGSGPGQAAVILRDLTVVRRGEGMHTDFVANVSHELRTPLAALVGFVETLQGPARDDPEATDRFLGLLDQQVARMRRLVDDLLSLSRIEMKEHSPPEERTDLARLIGAAADLLAPQAAATGGRIVVNTGPGLPMVCGDEDDLARLFQNLLENAVKYREPGSDVTVTLARDEVGDMVSAEVRDRGPGIAAEHLPRLTERFYRVDTARSRELGGTGLGLAIVKHIVNRHGGSLKIDSIANVGSTFTVRLPAAVAEIPGKPPESALS